MSFVAPLPSGRVKQSRRLTATSWKPQRKGVPQPASQGPSPGVGTGRHLKAVAKPAGHRAKLKLSLCVLTWARTTKLNTSLCWRNNLSNTLPKHKHMLGQKGPSTTGDGSYFASKSRMHSFAPCCNHPRTPICNVEVMFQSSCKCSSLRGFNFASAATTFSNIAYGGQGGITTPGSLFHRHHLRALSTHTGFYLRNNFRQLLKRASKT